MSDKNYKLHKEKLLWGGPGEKERSLEDKKVRRLKASMPDVQTTFYQIHNILHFAAFAAGSVLLKKPSGGPKGLIGPPCHGAPGRRRQ
jgi:hypothetical protein